jgi:hypothetical protein
LSSAITRSSRPDAQQADYVGAAAITLLGNNRAVTNRGV